MIEIPAYLLNHEAVIEAFGYWPSFHDANVLDFTCEQGEDPVITFKIHGWEMTPDLDEKRFFILKKHHLIAFRFSGILEADLPESDAGNILFGLAFSAVADFEKEGSFKVILDSVMGPEFDGEFIARKGEVLSVIPCDKKGRIA